MQWYEKDPCFHRSFSTGTKMKQSKNYLVCSRRCFPIFTTTEYHGFSLYTVQNEEIQILPPCHTHMTQFFWTPHAVPLSAKNFLKDRGGLCWSDPCPSAFRVKNQAYAATTTSHRSRLQSYDIHIFINMLKDVSTTHVVSVLSQHGHSCINRTRAHVLIYDNSNIHLIMRTRSICLSVSIVFLDLVQDHIKKGRSQRPYMYIF